MAHGSISSVAEPWLLLPLVYMQKPAGTVAEYSHKICHEALEDLIGNMRGGQSAYDEILREFVSRVYSELAEGEAGYFLDKTPRYFLIIPEISSLFPDAKFIFLFRNPADVYASILTTWGSSGFKRLWANGIDLEAGPVLLSRGYKLLEDRALGVRYEGLVSRPEESLRRIFTYLELEFDEKVLTTFVQELPKGRMGDPTGVKAYKTIVSGGGEKWKRVFDNRLRKRILFKYISGLPDHVLDCQGYDKNEILTAIKEHPVSRAISMFDCFYVARAAAICATKANLFFSSETRWARFRCLS